MEQHCDGYVCTKEDLKRRGVVPRKESVLPLEIVIFSLISCGCKLTSAATDSPNLTAWSLPLIGIHTQ